MSEQSRVNVDARNDIRQAVHQIEAYVAELQAAVVASMNTLGVTLVGEQFDLLTVSPIPDEEVAQMVRSAVGGVLGVREGRGQEGEQ